MATIAGFEYVDIEFQKDGAIHDPGDAARVLQFVADNAVTDLFVMSHGWNNDMADARDLYQRFFTEVRGVLDSGAAGAFPGRTFAVLGVLWPSKKFAEKDLIAGGAASLTGPGTDAAFLAQLDGLKGFFDAPDADRKLDRMKALAPALRASPAAKAEFVELARALPARRQVDADDGPQAFFTKPPDRVYDELAGPVLPGAPALAPGMGGAAGGVHGLPPVPPAGGGGAGPAAGLGDFFNKVGAAARNVLNLTTFYQMKERAYVVGAGGAYQLLRQVAQAPAAPKLHLIGHSFGGRLVTSVTDGPAGQPPLEPRTLTLLQAAFSHNGFASNFDNGRDGFFRKVVTDHKVLGPVPISHSVKDEAVGQAYPLAARLAGEDSSGLGDRTDKYGGIGRNGAIKTPEAQDGTLLPAGGAYAFNAGTLYNLNGDARIAGHSDICKPEIAYALLTAVATT